MGEKRKRKSLESGDLSDKNPASQDMEGSAQMCRTDVTAFDPREHLAVRQKVYQEPPLQNKPPASCDSRKRLVVLRLNNIRYPVKIKVDGKTSEPRYQFRRRTAHWLQSAEIPDDRSFWVLLGRTMSTVEETVLLKETPPRKRSYSLHLSIKQVYLSAISAKLMYGERMPESDSTLVRRLQKLSPLTQDKAAPENLTLLHGERRAIKDLLGTGTKKRT